MGRDTAECKEAGIGKRYWEEKKSKQAGIIFWRKKILGRDRKPKSWHNSLYEKILERDRKQKDWNNSWRGKR